MLRNTRPIPSFSITAATTWLGILLSLIVSLAQVGVALDETSLDTYVSNGTSFIPPNNPSAVFRGEIRDEFNPFVLFGARVFSVVSVSGAPNSDVLVAIQVNSLGNETGTTFSINFDQTKMSINGTSGTNINPDVIAGTDAPFLTRTVNATQVGSGRIGVALSNFALTAGARQIIVFRFRILPGAAFGATPISFGNVPVVQSTTNAEAQTLTASYTNGTITIGAGSPGSIQFTSATYTVAENGGSASVTLSRTGGSNGAVSVLCGTTAGGTATQGQDYTGTVQTVSWANGDIANKTFVFSLLDDNVFEGNETVNLALQTFTGGATPGTTVNAVLSILENDQPPTLMVNNISALENTGAPGFGFTITLAGQATQSVSVTVSTSNGSAVAPGDYTAILPTTITFTPGQLTRTVNVNVIDDANIESDETFFLNLSNPVNATITAAQGSATIRNDDAPTCTSASIAPGQSVASTLGSNSCMLAGNRVSLFHFTATVGQRVAVTMSTVSFLSRIELLDPSGAVIDVATPASGTMDSRLPSTGFRPPFTTPGMYTIRAIATGGGSGPFSLSLFSAASTACMYTVSPTLTNVPSTGGTFFFDVLTQPGCAPEAPPVVPVGAIYSLVSYVNGRVTYNVRENTGAMRQAFITVANQSHTIIQFGAGVPANNLFANAQCILGSPPGCPVTPGPVVGSNTGATPEPGEPAHAGNIASKSVWYSFTPPALASGLYSFSTAGSSFDTVMAIYSCPPSEACTFANMTRVGSNDDTTSFDNTSKINFRADAGTRYVIAVDGKEGATGTIRLAFTQFERLFRLYLQNFNGNPVTIVPDTVRATNTAGSIRNATLIATGVYEFNLPADGTTYTARITGPAGIDWDPNDIPLDTSFRLLDEFMRGPTSGGADSTSNPICLTAGEPCIEQVYVRNISAADAHPITGRLRVKVGYSREMSTAARVEENCRYVDNVFSSMGFTHASFECKRRPQTNHDVRPAMEGKRFVQSVYPFGPPVVVESNDLIESPRFEAFDERTFVISGRVIASGAGGGEGTIVDLRYTPVGQAPTTLNTLTGPNGVYEFRELAPGTYQPSARREGFEFHPRAAVVIALNSPGNTFPDVNITERATCTSSAVDPPELASGAVNGSFEVTTNPSNCAWTATENETWLTLDVAAGNGSGSSVSYRAMANDGPAARTGMVFVSGRSAPVMVRQAAGLNPTPVITGISPPTRTAGDPAFNLTITGTGFFSGSRVTLNNGPERVPLTVNATQIVVPVASADVAAAGVVSVRVVNPPPGGNTSNALNLNIMGCGYQVTAPVLSFPPSGGSGMLNVATTSGCGYTASANDYCMVTGLDGGGTGSGTVNFTISANAGVARSAVITVGGQFVTINQTAASESRRSRFDFDGDGKADLAVYRPSIGTWFVQRLGSAAFDSLRFGLPEDITTAADYDGDGRTDIAVFRPSNQFWYRTNSGNGNFVPEQFGGAGDIPVPADYDGDGRDNIAVFRPSNGTWYTSTNPAINYGAVVFGAAGDIPRPADYDGDGRADIAVYRPSNGVWYGIRSSNQQMFAVAFGTAGDMPVPADYDGDGRAELAVFRPSQGFWYRMNLATGAFTGTQWGQLGDLPVPADYNGDKFADVAVYRPSNGFWYVWSCTNNPLFAAQPFGLSSDRVIPFTN